MRATPLRFVLFGALTVAAACGGDRRQGSPTASPSVTPAAESTAATAPAVFSLRSDAFSDGNYIPKEFSCDGANVSPALRWSGAPAASKAFALIADDPDAPGGTFVHWVLYDLPATATELARAVPNNPSLDNGSKQGVGGSRKTGYSGPCPPAGKDHHYSFRIYAPRHLAQPRTRQEQRRSRTRDAGSHPCPGRDRGAVSEVSTEAKGTRRVWLVTSSE